MTDVSLAQNLEAVRANLRAAAAAANRDPATIELVAVSKTHPESAVRAALAAGQRIFGENRVQEAQLKFPPLRAQWPDLRLHLIGPLQTNKAVDAVRLFDVIETLDRPKLAAALASAMAKLGRRPECLVQVNTGEEPQKAGVPPSEVVAFVNACRTDHRLPVTGLMCIPPVNEPAAPHFAMLRELAREAKLEKLSMGMSGDYELAVRFGATNVRVGTAIFGERPPLR